jgi:ABC-2 type transport system permease protein
MQMHFQRLRALVYKETVQTFRDRRALLLLILLPLIQLFLMAYAVKLTVDHLPTALVDQSLDTRSRDFVSALQESGYFDVTVNLNSEDEVIDAIDKGQVKAGIVIHPNLAADVERGQGSVQILLDGSDSFSVSSGYNAASAIAQKYSIDLTTEKIEQTKASLSSLTSAQPATTATRVLYNPDMADLIFILPGLIALIMQNVIVGHSAMAVVSEREAGTLEQILATPARPIERIVAKMLAGTLVVVLDMAIVLLLGVFWFGVPFKGDPWLFALLSLLFILSGLGLGLFISSVARNQRQAQQFAAVLNLFTMLLTGFLYPRTSMPLWTQWIGNLIPLTYFIRIVRGIFTKGVGITFLWPDVAALVVYSTLAILLAALVSKPRLD